MQNLKLKVKNSSKGFTLIELLIVIAIIGVLATLLMVNFVGVRQRARDAQRKSDLRQIQSALELYRSDQGSYPALGTSAGQYPTTCGSALTDPNNTITYMQKIPCDPLGGNYTYAPTNGDASYTVVACLENLNDNQKDSVSNTTDCPTNTNTTSYTVTNP